MRVKYLEQIAQYLSDFGEALPVASNKIAFLPNDDTVEQTWLTVTVSQPKGERVKQPGQPTYYLGYDGLFEHETYMAEMKIKEQKKAEVQAKKQKKIEVDKKRRELEKQAREKEQEKEQE